MAAHCQWQPDDIAGENASNDFNQFSSAFSWSVFRFIAENVKKEMANCRLQATGEHHSPRLCVVCAGNGREQFSFAVCAPAPSRRTSKEPERGRGGSRNGKCHRWQRRLRSAMAISHHQIENCMRRAHNKTRALPFVFAAAVAAAAACILTKPELAYHPSPECLQEIDNICLQMTCQPLIFLPFLFVAFYSLLFRSLYAAPLNAGFFLLDFVVSPPLSEIVASVASIVRGHRVAYRQLQSDGACKVHANASIHSHIPHPFDAALAGLTNSLSLVRPCVCKRRLKKRPKRVREENVTFVWLNATEVHSECRIPVSGSEHIAYLCRFRFKNHFVVAFRVTIPNLFIDTLRYTDRKTRYIRSTARQPLPLKAALFLLFSVS